MAMESATAQKTAPEAPEGAAAYNPFTLWSKEALEEGIAEVESKISVLGAEVAESKRVKIAKYERRIERVKERLNALGADLIESLAKKGKRAVKKKKKGRGSTSKARKKVGRKTARLRPTTM